MKKYTVKSPLVKYIFCLLILHRDHKTIYFVRHGKAIHNIEAAKYETLEGIPHL